MFQKKNSNITKACKYFIVTIQSAFSPSYSSTMISETVNWNSSEIKLKSDPTRKAMIRAQLAVLLNSSVS